MTQQDTSRDRVLSDCDSRRRRWSFPLRVNSLPDLIWLVLFTLAAVYIVLFVARFRDSIGAILWDADYSSGFTLAETVTKTGTGGHTVISTTGAYIPLWFGLLTANLPFHRQLWEVMPTVLFISTATMIGWSVAQFATRRAALLATLIVVIASPWALSFFMAPVAHNTVYPCTALLGIYLIWLTRGGERSHRTTIVVPLLATLALGLAIASDALLIITGVIPFAITAAITWLQRSQQARLVALSALGTVLGAIPIAVLTRTIMRHIGFVTVLTAPPLGLASLSTIPEHTRLLFEGFRELSNGYLAHGWPGKLHVEIGLACDAVTVAALLTFIVVGLHNIVSFVRSRWHHNDSGVPAKLARMLHIIYWTSSAIVVCAAFEFTTAAGFPGYGQRHESYYATTIFSIAAVIPLLIRPRHLARWLVPVGASIIMLGSIVGLKRNYLTAIEPPIARYASQIVRLAEVNHTRTGYAGYWDASSLTWNSHERVLVRPLMQCSHPSGASICPFFLMRVPSWYVSRRHNSFLLVDPNENFVTTLPTGLGTPTASYVIGDIQMYIYPYDIASRLGPPST